MNPDQLLTVIGDLEVERRRLMAVIAGQQEQIADLEARAVATTAPQEASA